MSAFVNSLGQQVTFQGERPSPRVLGDQTALTEAGQGAAETGPGRRFVVTNRAGASWYLEATYDEYVLRGESENRNKELKCGLGMDRLSDHRFLANYFRLYLHAAAMNLLVRSRREIAAPPPAPEGDVPVEALVGEARKHYQNARRREDPLGKG